MFLDASSHLYNRLCLLVGWSVGNAIIKNIKIKHFWLRARDSTTRFVRRWSVGQSVGRLVGWSVTLYFSLWFYFFDLTIPAQMVWWPQIWPLPTLTRLRKPCIRPCWLKRWVFVLPAVTFSLMAFSAFVIDETSASKVSTFKFPNVSKVAIFPSNVANFCANAWNTRLSYWVLPLPEIGADVEKNKDNTYKSHARLT